jgi:flagellar hook-associated protein 3 FlgL
MTTISGYSQSSRAVVNSANQFADQKNTLDTLQTQLSSGKIAYTYAGLGAGAATSLSMNARLTTLNGYGSAITNAQTRVSLASTGLQQMSSLSKTLATDLTGNYMTDIAQRGQVQTIAKGDFAEAVDTLNSDINGNYLFSGRATDTQPVASMDTILNGANDTTVTIARTSPDSNTDAGMNITSATSSNLSAITFTATAATPPTTPPTTSPASMAFNVISQPTAGDTISLTLKLPDGTPKVLTLTAGTATSTAGDTFAIGATLADTAANIKAALGSQLSTTIANDLPAASTMRASTDFFDGKYPSDKVVQWYKGDSATTPTSRVSRPRWQHWRHSPSPPSRRPRPRSSAPSTRSPAAPPRTSSARTGRTRSTA